MQNEVPEKSIAEQSYIPKEEIIVEGEYEEIDAAPVSSNGTSAHQTIDEAQTKSAEKVASERNAQNGAKPSVEPEITFAEADEARTQTVEEYAREKRPRSLRMQYRFLRSVIFSFWLFGRMIFWQGYVARIFPNWVEETNIKRLQKYAREFRAFAISMGGVFIKLGQFASTRADILPEEVIKELTSLQDEVPALPFDRIQAVIQKELGDINARFAKIDEASVASASLGQVYRAKLHSGERVVIKVQRPGIRKIVYTDLSALFVIAHVAMKFAFIHKRADTVALSEEFGKVLLEEVSYKNEVKNAERFAKMFKDNLGVYVPGVYHEHSTDSIITMEDVTTIKVNDYEAIEAAGISRKAVAKRLMDTYLTQIFKARFFHADPHPGNLFIYPLPVEDESVYMGRGGRPFYLIFIDFGMTGTLTPEIVQGIINTLSAMINQDARKLVHSYVELGFILPNADLEPIIEASRLAFTEMWGMSMVEMRNMDMEKANAIGEEFSDLLHNMPFRVPQDFVYLGRTFSILMGMCTAIDPGYNPWKEMQYYTQKLIQNQVRTGGEASDLIGEAFTQILGTGPRALFGALERTIAPGQSKQSELLKQVVEGDVVLTTRLSPQYRHQLNRIETTQKRTNRAIIFGSLLIASTLFYTHGDTFLAIGGYGLSTIAFLAMVFTRSRF